MRVIKVVSSLLLVLSTVLAGDMSYLVKFSVNLGPQNHDSFLVRINPSWAPLGAERFKELVEGNGRGIYRVLCDILFVENFFDAARFFRVVPGFMAQFGISAKPDRAAYWREKKLKDDPVLKSNTRGYISFATSGPNSRTTQMFINYADNANLDSMGFAPFGLVEKGMDVVDKIYAGYGEKPDQQSIQMSGNKYLKKHFPKLSYIEKVEIVSADSDL